MIREEAYRPSQDSVTDISILVKRDGLTKKIEASEPNLQGSIRGRVERIKSTTGNAPVINPHSGGMDSSVIMMIGQKAL